MLGRHACDLTGCLGPQPSTPSSPIIPSQPLIYNSSTFFNLLIPHLHFKQLPVETPAALSNDGMVSRISSHSLLASCVAPVQQAVVASPGSSYQTLVGMQPSTQQSNMGNQMQGMMVQYPPVQSYQVGGTKRGQRSEPRLRCEPVKSDLLLSLCS